MSVQLMYVEPGYCYVERQFLVLNLAPGSLSSNEYWWWLVTASLGGNWKFSCV